MKNLTTIAVTLLALGTAGTAFSQVSLYSISKDELLNQTSTAAPTLDLVQPFRLNTEVTVAASTDLSSNPTATKPAGGTGASPLTLTYNAGSGKYQNRPFFADRASLDAAYLDGTYVMHMVSPSFGTKDVNLTLNPASYTIPTDIPKLTNTTWSGNALVLDATVSNTLFWNAFTQLAGNDIVQFKLTGPSVNISLSGNLTSDTINANTLAAGNTYSGSIDFIHETTMDTTSVSGATGIAGYRDRTSFTVQAVPEPASATLLAGGALLLFGHRRIRRRSEEMLTS